MTNGKRLGDAVRLWVTEELPDEPTVAERAAFVARSAYERGASISEACEEARSFVSSWVRHPAHVGQFTRPRGHEGVLPLAS